MTNIFIQNKKEIGGYNLISGINYHSNKTSALNFVILQRER